MIALLIDFGLAMGVGINEINVVGMRETLFVLTPLYCIANPLHSM